ncbi:MAG TPA: sirohydrochlorin chelatase [Planctomycetaceae bacterium]|nr:sirohydrochlorin chelatase [Planctomycetaceae bacterium]
MTLSTTNRSVGVSSLGRSDGVLLVGHGTRDTVGTDQFFQLGKLLADRLSPVPVEACLLELQPPTIAEGWQRLVDRGAKAVHAVPLLLFAAGHAKSDIPDELAKCQLTTPHVRWDQSQPLSRAAELIALSLRRIDEAIRQSNLDSRSSALVMVGRGSHDPCAQADMRVLTECVARRWCFKVRQTAFYAMATPKLPETLDRIAESGEVSDILVQPHILFEGSIHQSILGIVAQARQRYPEIRFWCSGYLGPEPELVDALIRRIQQAIAVSVV